VRPAQQVRGAGRRGKQHALLVQEGRAGVLHAAVGKLGQQHQVVFREREFAREVALEIRGRLAVQAQDVARVRLGGLEPRAAHEQAHRVAFGAQRLERPCGEGEQVGGDRFGFLEFDLSRNLLFHPTVRNCLPVMRQFQLERKLALQVRLVEAGEQRACVRGHEQRVDVFRAVLAVLVACHRAAGYRDRRLEIERNGVDSGLQRFRRDNKVFADGTNRTRPAIDLRVPDLLSSPVQYQVYRFRWQLHFYFKVPFHNVRTFNQMNAECITYVAIAFRPPSGEFKRNAGLDGRDCGGGHGQEQSNGKQDGAHRLKSSAYHTASWANA
jgi:hypothetical protein